MNFGVILIFYNNEDIVNDSLFSTLFSLSKTSALCLVNNGSLDNTLNKLKLLNEEHESKAMIVDVKKNKGDDLAIRAGVRYLLNKENLVHIGYLNTKAYLTNSDLIKFIEIILKNKESISSYNLLRLENNRSQRIWFKNVFSFNSFIESTLFVSNSSA